MKSTNKTNIAQLGHPILRAIAQPIEKIPSADTQSLINQMMVCVKQAGGVGIAAPQLHINQRVFIICSTPNERYPNAPLIEPTAIINPKILEKSNEMVSDWEGCLSVPAIRGFVPRHKTIKAQYFDSEGNQHIAEFHGFVARIFQHEIDHLDGLTFIDRVISTKDLISESEWYRQFHQKSE
ncbi:peptide deformylase [Colwelliaceae bacterium 6441]